MSRVGSLVPVDVLNALVPSADFAEFHSRRVAAPPNLVDRAIRSVTLREMPVVKMLFALRSLPDRLTGRPGLPTSDKLPLLDQMLGAGFMLLAGRSKSRNSHRNNRSGEGTPESRRRKAKGDELAGFDQPGFVKIAMNFHLIDLGSSTRLDTASRVAATRRAFTAYWLLIRPVDIDRWSTANVKG